MINRIETIQEPTFQINGDHHKMESPIHRHDIFDIDRSYLNLANHNELLSPKCRDSFFIHHIIFNNFR